MAASTRSIETLARAGVWLTVRCAGRQVVTAATPPATPPRSVTPSPAPSRGASPAPRRASRSPSAGPALAGFGADEVITLHAAGSGVGAARGAPAAAADPGALEGPGDPAGSGGTRGAPGLQAPHAALLPVGLPSQIPLGLLPDIWNAALASAAAQAAPSGAPPPAAAADSGDMGSGSASDGYGASAAAAAAAANLGLGPGCVRQRPRKRSAAAMRPAKSDVSSKACRPSYFCPPWVCSSSVRWGRTRHVRPWCKGFLSRFLHRPNCSQT